VAGLRPADPPTRRAHRTPFDLEVPMKKQPLPKMKLHRETVLRLQTPPAGGKELQAVLGGVATRPPVCEMSNFITCHC